MSRYHTESLFSSDQPDQSSFNHIIRVAFGSGVDAQFDYLVADKFWPVSVGQRVDAPFGGGNKIQTGFCVETNIALDKSFAARTGKRKLKAITGVVDKGPLLDAGLMELARWISSYYVCPLGQVLSAMVPAAVKKGTGVKKQKFIYLAADFEQHTGKIKGKKQQQIVAALQQQSAFDMAAGLKLQNLLDSLGTTTAPVKKLAQQQVVRIFEKEVLPSLPAIAAPMIVKSDRIILNDDQQNALNHIKGQLDSEKFSVTVLYGVTDSGKTEVYIRAIDAVLQKGKTAIVMLPEIALTAQTVQRFSTRFEKIAVLHSQLTAAQRSSQWHKIRNGDADVVIGARSAVFAPLQRLGIIIVDEEHEPSYKQDNVPRYHGRDVAIKRAQIENAHCILGSATPCLETLYNCQKRKHFTVVRLPKRIKDAAAPQMRLVDLRKELSANRGINLISGQLEKALRIILDKKEQAILLLNRRGYSNFIFCPSCKHTLQCRNCDVTLTFHKKHTESKGQVKTITGTYLDYGSAVCHYCGAKTLVPQRCPLCSGPFIMIGMGSQRLEEELKTKFPLSRVARVDSDSMVGQDYYRLLKNFGEGKIDILAGTQMLAKGLHFPNVTLVGIISADTCLYLPDFRTNERTFQLISQVAGRAGRCEKKGVVFVQTFLPEQPAIKYALAGNFEGFVEEELKHRKSCNLPPFWRLAVIVLRDMNFERLEAACNNMKQLIDVIVRQNSLQAIVRGPMPAVISRIQRFHRMQIIIQTPDAQILQQLFAALRNAGTVKPAVQVAIDIDPVNLL
jgi:primosomal protein N' (replication factor Y) (superfamily II helicase)